MTWLDSGGQWSRSQQAKYVVAKASTSRWGVKVHLLVQLCGILSLSAVHVRLVVFTGMIACTTGQLQVFSLRRGWIFVFLPHRATRCTDRDEILLQRSVLYSVGCVTGDVVWKPAALVHSWVPSWLCHSLTQSIMM